MRKTNKHDWYDRERGMEEYENGIDQGGFGNTGYRSALEQILVALGIPCVDRRSYKDGGRRKGMDSTMTPERYLALATIEQAMADTILARAGVVPPEVKKCYDDWVMLQTSEDWLMNDDCGEPWGFVTLCDMLGFDPVALREKTMSIAKKYCALVGE